MTQRKEMSFDAIRTMMPPEVVRFCQAAKDAYWEREAILSDGGPITPEIIEMATVEARRVNSREILREINQENL